MSEVLRLTLLSLALSLALPALAEDVYLSKQDFLDQAFDGQPPATEILWLNQQQKAAAKRILGHPYRGLRVRYWPRQTDNGARSAWIFDEIGKEYPITIGVVIDNNAIDRVRILIYRESRGYEVRHPYFTQQFAGRVLEEDLSLDDSIDGITGATLSVHAVTNVSRLALYLHQSVVAQDHDNR